MKKRGQLDSTFKYIFILIVGALFLMFFVRFAMQYASTAETIDVSRWLLNLEDRLSALGSVSDATSYPTFSTISELMVLEGTLTSGRISHSTDMIIYSPLNLNTDQPLIWTRRWNYPYDIASFFYFSSRDRRYYVIYQDTNLENYITDLIGTESYPSIPREFNFEIVTLDTLRNDFEMVRNIAPNFQENVFIFIGEKRLFDPLENSVNNVPNSRIVIVEPGSTEKNKEYGDVYIDGQKTMYLGREMLYGTFFVDNMNNYDYNLNLALERLESITGIYMSKSNFLRGKKPECGYNLFSENLLKIYKDLAESKSKNPKDYSDLVDSLIRRNKDFRGGCVSVF